MSAKREIRRFIGGILLAGALVLSAAPANSGPGGFEEKFELNGNTISICVRANLKNRCLPVTFEN